MTLLEKNQEEMEALADEFEERFEEIFTLAFLLASAEILLLTSTTLNRWDERWSRVLQKAGFYDLLQEYSKRLDEIDKSARKIATGVVDKKKLSLLKKLQIKELEKIGIDAGLNLKKGLYKHIMVGVTQQDLVKAMAKDLQGSRFKSYAKTYVSTAVNDYRQLLLNERAKPADVWVYEGADVDNKTRDFCKCVLNQQGYFNLDQKIAIELNPKRRYNCRHGLFPISEKEALKNGYSKAVGVCK